MSEGMPRKGKYAALNAQLTGHLEACANGDRAAFDDIYKLTSAKFTAILMNMVRDEAACADIMQKAYLSIWTNAGTFCPQKGKAFTWMLVIMRNRALDSLRSRSRYRETETLSGDVIDTLKDDGRCPEDHMQSIMIRRMIDPHLSELKPNVALAITLSTRDGMTAREIGEVLGVPTNTAKSWLRRGLKSLRKSIEKSEDHRNLYEIL